MRNPFRIIRLILRWRNPRSVKTMEAVADDFWLRRGYIGLTFFGYLVTPTKEEADRVNRGLAPVLANHEAIHLRQAQSTHNSWVCFYVRYLWYWLRALHLNRRMPNAAYRLNPFEMEAYDNELNLHYLDNIGKKGTNGWRRYAKMTPNERLAEYLRTKVV